MAFGLLLLRLAVGLTLAAHGAQKLFGWFGGHGLAGTGQFMEMIGFAHGRRKAFLAGLSEAGGGLLLALGLLTPIAAAMLIAVMLVAVVSVHLTKGFFASGGGYEYNLILAIAAVSIAFTGPGALSLDAFLSVPFDSMISGIAAVLIGAAAAIELLGRHHQAHASQPAAA